MDWAAGEPDVSVWHTKASYRDSRFGMLWVNDLLRRHGQGRWCVVVDPDEFLVYPMMETRSLRALGQFLEDDHRPCLHALWSTPTATGRWPNAPRRGRRPVRGLPVLRPRRLPGARLGQLDLGAGRPADARAFRRPARAGTGPEQDPLRPLAAALHYNMSTHDAWPRRLNRAHAQDEVSTTGVLSTSSSSPGWRPRPPRRRSAASAPPAASTRATAKAGRVLRRGPEPALRGQRAARRARADGPGPLVLSPAQPAAGRP